MKNSLLALAAFMMTAPAMAQLSEPSVGGNDGIGADPAALYCGDSSNPTMKPIVITGAYVKTNFQGIIQVENIARVEFKMKENDRGLVGVTKLLNAKGKVIATMYQQDGKDTVVLADAKARSFICDNRSI